MKKIYILFFIIVSSLGYGQMIQKTSCSKKASEISNKAINHMINLEFLTARGMAEAALIVDENCGCAKLVIARVSSANKDYGTRANKLKMIDRSSLSGEEKVWYDALSSSDKEKYSVIQKEGEVMFPKSPFIHYLATGGLNFISYKAFAEKFPKYASSAYNMMSYGYLRGDYGSVDKEKAMEYVKKSQSMHDGPNAYDSMAEHYASLGEFDKAVENQLKAYDYATFSSPYQTKLREYSRKANNEELVKNIEKLQSDMQDAILKGDKEAFKKFTHPDITISTGDSNLGEFYDFSEENLKLDENFTWDSFELENMKVYFSTDMNTAVITFYAKGGYTMNRSSELFDLNGNLKSTSEFIEYSTRASSVWVNTDQGWKTMHSNFAPNKGKIGLPQ
jgi:tetratricopeptide (TPR) repeat protein